MDFDSICLKKSRNDEVEVEEVYKGCCTEYIERSLLLLSAVV